MLTGETFWLVEADKSAIGGYARFVTGELVDHLGPAGMFTAPGDYHAGVAGAVWATALRAAAPIELAEVVTDAFPDGGDPPVFDPRQPDRSCPFGWHVLDDDLE